MISESNKKKAMQQKNRLFLLILGIIVLFGSSIAIFIFSAPKEISQTESSAVYTITTESDYKVHLLPNELFANEWMEDGQIYSSLLTDYIEVDLSSTLMSNHQIEVSGEYNVTAVFEGYQERQEMKKIIYERRYPLVSGTFDKSQKKKISIHEKIKVHPEVHKEYAKKAESILGGSTSKILYLLFEGTFFINEEEKTFEYQINIPIGNDIYYEIKNPQPIVTKGELTKITQITVKPPLKEYSPYIASAVFGLILVIYITFFVRVKEDDEVWEDLMKKIMKKYASRMICVEELPNEKSNVILRLKEISSIIALSEELREPVLYCINEKGLPLDGAFYILGSEYTYLLQYPMPSTTLGVEKEEPSSDKS